MISATVLDIANHVAQKLPHSAVGPLIKAIAVASFGRHGADLGRKERVESLVKANKHVSNPYRNGNSRRWNPTRLIAAGCAVVAIGCGAEVSVPEPAMSNWWAIPVSKACPPFSQPADRIPQSTFSDSDTRDLSHRERLGKYLGAAELEPLWCGSVPVEAYRLFWFPSYRAALGVEVSNDDDKWTVTVVEFMDPREARSDSAARFKIANRRIIEVGDDIRRFLDTARTSAIWSSKEVYTGTEDGTSWTLEALHKREYRAHHRANAPSPALDRLARSFVELGGLQWDTELKKRQ